MYTIHRYEISARVTIFRVVKRNIVLSFSFVRYIVYIIYKYEISVRVTIFRVDKRNIVPYRFIQHHYKFMTYRTLQYKFVGATCMGHYFFRARHYTHVYVKLLDHLTIITVWARHILPHNLYHITNKFHAHVVNTGIQFVDGTKSLPFTCAKLRVRV